MPKNASNRYLVENILDEPRCIIKGQRKGLNICINNMIKKIFTFENNERNIMNNFSLRSSNNTYVINNSFNFGEFCDTIVRYIFNNRPRNNVCNNLRRNLGSRDDVIYNIIQLKENVYRRLANMLRNERNEQVKQRFRKVRPLLDHCYGENERGKIEALAGKLEELVTTLGGFDNQRVVDMLLIVLARAVVDKELAENVGVEDWHYYWLRDAIRNLGEGEETLPLCLTRGDVAVFLYLLLGLASAAAAGADNQHHTGEQTTGTVEGGDGQSGEGG